MPQCHFAGKTGDGFGAFAGSISCQCGDVKGGVKAVDKGLGYLDDVRDAQKTLTAKVDTAKGGPLPYGGNSKPHGNANHNSPINNRVGELKQDPSVSNIRKNQQQVDVTGNKVGTNRPDIQYD